MVEEAGVGIVKACLNRIRESRLKSETRSNLIHILSRCYEDPNASRIFSPPSTRSGGEQLDGPGNALEFGDVQRTNGSDDIEEGEIDIDDASVPSHISMEDKIDTLQDNETCADQSTDYKQRKLSGEVSCPEFPSSVLVGIEDKDNGKYHQASSDACAENGGVKSNYETKENASIASVPNDGFGRPADSRSQVFYGDILGEATPPPPGSLKMNADHTKKKKRGGSKEKKKVQKRKKRAEMDKKLGVKRMKLPPPLKPKVVKVCEHYLKGRCLKGEECPFSHDATPLTKLKACVHFARNNCMKGDACPYDHELWKYPCDNYASKGFCSRGSSCLFSHEIPAKEAPGTSIAEKVRLQFTPVPETASNGLVNSAAKLSVNTPMQVPRGLSFLSFGKSSSDQLTRPDLSNFLQKDDLTGSNHSNRHMPGVVKTLDVTSIPFATPVRSNNVPYLESRSDHSSNRKNSASKAFSSEKRVDITNPLDQALQGLNSLVSSKVPVNHFSNECRPGLATKEHNPPVSRLSGLKLHQSLGLSADKEKPGFESVAPKEQTSKSNSQVVAHMCEGATQAKESGVYCFSSKTSTVKPNQKLITTIPKDKKSEKKFSIQDRGRQSVYVNPLAISELELKSSASVVSPSSQGMAVHKTMSPFSQGMSVNKAMPASVDFVSTSTLASNFESGAKGSSLGTAGASQLQTKPEIASSGKSSSNFRPVKASAILDFIFGTDSKNKY